MAINTYLFFKLGWCNLSITSRYTHIHPIYIHIKGMPEEKLNSDTDPTRLIVKFRNVSFQFCFSSLFLFFNLSWWFNWSLEIAYIFHLREILYHDETVITGVTKK